MRALRTDAGSDVAGERVERLHGRYARAIRRYCLRRLRSREEAEDATQAVFLTAYRCLVEGVEPRAEAAWLFKIAENVVLQRRRAMSRRARVEYAVDVDRIADVVAASPREATPELDGVRDALAAMPEAQRQAIVLREWCGLSYREVAGELGISMAAAEALIFRARRGLVRRLERRDQLEGNGRSFGLCVPALALKLLLGSGGLGAKAVVGAASIAVVATAAQPGAPPFELAAAGARVARPPAATRLAAVEVESRPAGRPLQALAVPATALDGAGAPAASPSPSRSCRAELRRVTLRCRLRSSASRPGRR
jgi:RNA polymerase sigma-70 factor, ECF subfamily